MSALRAHFDVDVDTATPEAFARLSGDWNPLHTNPEYASHTVYGRPILHGAATLGIGAHAIVRELDYSAERLASISARFFRPVFPGETIRTEMWPTPTRISFQCRVLGRDEIVLTNGLATLRV